MGYISWAAPFYISRSRLAAVFADRTVADVKTDDLLEIVAMNAPKLAMSS
jgi:hypothetical protein